MTGSTAGGLPYLQNHEPLADVADAMKALAQAVDVRPYSYKKFGAGQSHTNGTWVTVTGMADDGGTVGMTYSAGTGTWTVTQAGRYQIIAMVQFPPTGGGTRGTQVLKGGTAVATMLSPAATNSSGARLVDEVRFAAGDTFVLQGFQASGGTINSNDATAKIRMIGG